MLYIAYDDLSQNSRTIKLQKEEFESTKLDQSKERLGRLKSCSAEFYSSPKPAKTFRVYVQYCLVGKP